MLPIRFCRRYGGRSAGAGRCRRQRSSIRQCPDLVHVCDWFSQSITENRLLHGKSGSQCRPHRRQYVGGSHDSRPGLQWIQELFQPPFRRWAQQQFHPCECRRWRQGRRLWCRLCQRRSGRGNWPEGHEQCGKNSDNSLRNKSLRPWWSRRRCCGGYRRPHLYFVRQQGRQFRQQCDRFCCHREHHPDGYNFR